MYYGDIMSAGELIQRVQAKASEQKALDALGILNKIYKERQVVRSEEASAADFECLKTINDICDKTLIGRFVLPLPAGAGKTTLIVAWCTFIHQSGCDYSVAIASLQVEACFKLRGQLMAQGIPAHDIGVLYSDNDKKMAHFKEMCPSTDTPSKHRFLLVAHARLEERSYRRSRLGYKGEDRSIIFYDEEFRPRKGFSFDILSLKQNLSGFVNVAEDLKVKGVSDNDLRSIKKLSCSILTALNYHLDCRAEPKQIAIPSEAWTDLHTQSVLKIVKTYNRKLGLTDDVVEFFEHVINGSQMSLKDSKVYGYMGGIPDEIQQVLVLDASYRFSKLSQLDEDIRSLPIDAPRAYRNLTVTYADCPSGKHSISQILNTPKKRADFMGRVAEYLRGIPDGEAVLIFTFKDRAEERFAEVIRRELSQMGFNMDERIITKDGQSRPKYAFLTWGQQNGTNDYMYCRHMCTIGVLDLGADNLIAQAVAQTEGRYLFDDDAISVQELSVSDCAQRIYQALCRTAIRNQGDDDPCTVALFLNRNALDCIDILRKALPQAKFLKRGNVFKTSETTTDKVLKDVVSFLQGLADDVKEISTKQMFKLIGASYNRPITRPVKTLVMRKLKAVLGQECCWWEHEGRTLKRTPFFH